LKKINIIEIKEKLKKHYQGHILGPDRELHVSVNKDSHGTVGSVFFSLDGSPPKGYAIYIPELRLLNLYDNHGRRFQILRECRLDFEL